MPGDGSGRRRAGGVTARRLARPRSPGYHVPADRGGEAAPATPREGTVVGGDAPDEADGDGDGAARAGEGARTVGDDREPGGDAGVPGSAARARRRRAAAVAVLAVWIAVLAWHAKRLYLRPEAERLAAGARTIPPGVAYYAVFQGDRQIGWAQSNVDTIPSGGGFLVRDRLELELDAFGLPGRAELRSRARLGPALELRSFSVGAGGLLGGLTAQGAVEADSLLVVAVERGGSVSVRRIPLEGRVVLTTALPMRLAAEGTSGPGDRYRVRTFDPASMEQVTRVVEIDERAMMTYPDSAVRGPDDGAWRPGRRDTVLAWRMGRQVAGRSLEIWIDSDGRYLEVRTGGGLRLSRTAYELAFDGARGQPVRHGEVRRLESGEDGDADDGRDEGDEDGEGDGRAGGGGGDRR